MAFGQIGGMVQSAGRAAALAVRPMTSGPIDAQTQAQIQRILGLYRPDSQLAPRTGAQLRQQASTDVMSQVGPVEQQIRDQLTAQGEAAQAAARQDTQGYADAVKALAPAVKTAYDSEQSRMAAADAALASSLKGQGDSAYAGLASMLGTSGAPGASLGAVAQGTTLPAASAATIGRQTGNVALDQMIGNAGAATARMAQLPVEANLAGMRQSNILGQQNLLDIADQTGKVNATVPGLVSNELKDLQSNETNKAQLRNDQQKVLATLIQDTLSKGADRQTQLQIANIGLGRTQLTTAAQQADAQLAADVKLQTQQMADQAKLAAASASEAAAYQRTLATQGGLNQRQRLALQAKLKAAQAAQQAAHDRMVYTRNRISADITARNSFAIPGAAASGGSATSPSAGALTQGG